MLKPSLVHRPPTLPYAQIVKVIRPTHAIAQVIDRINTNGDLERVTLADVHLHMYAASPQTRNCFVRLFSFVDVRIADMHLGFCYLLILLVSIFRIYIIHLHTFHMYSIHSMAAPVLAGSFGRAHSRPKRPKFGSRVRISRAR